MNFEGINFPVYRKYKNNKSYFKIMNASEFEEIQVIGSRRVLRHTVAKLYPEKIFIQDLLLNYAEMADEISAEEYESMKL